MSLCFYVFSNAPVIQYRSINCTKKLMMFTSTNKMIYVVAMECYKVAIFWYQQIICLPFKQIFNDNRKKLSDRS